MKKNTKSVPGKKDIIESLNRKKSKKKTEKHYNFEQYVQGRDKLHNDN